MYDLSQLAGFEWDSGSDRKNEKHGVSRAEAEQIFFNRPLIVSSDVKHSDLEARLHALGRTDAGRLLQLTFTLRSFGQKLRVISARDMHRRERKIYGQTA